MALSNAELAVALRLAGSTTEALPEGLSSVLDRLRIVAEAVVAQYASADTPEDAKDLAATLIAAYTFDQPPASRGSGYSNSWVNSGASVVIEPWRRRRAAVLGEDS